MFSNINSIWKSALFLPIIFRNTWWIYMFHWVLSAGLHWSFPSQAFIGCVSEEEKWCCCEFLLWAEGTCVQVGAAPKGFYTCRIPKVYDSLLDAMRYVSGKVTDKLSFPVTVPDKLPGLELCSDFKIFVPRHCTTFIPCFFLMWMGPDSPHKRSCCIAQSEAGWQSLGHWELFGYTLSWPALSQLQQHLQVRVLW